MFAMLFVLLKISKTEVNQHDATKLYTKIITLIDKVTREPFYEQNHKKVLLTNKEILSKLKEGLSKARGQERH